MGFTVRREDRELPGGVPVERALPLERLRQGDIQLVVSAMYLPDMTAIELLHRLRESSQHADTPFMLVSSETRFQYLDPIRQARVAGILPKPFSDQKLRTALAATLDMLSHTLIDHDLEQQALRVLVVDDSPMARKHISRVLKSLGIERIDLAVDGGHPTRPGHGREKDHRALCTGLYYPALAGSLNLDRFCLD